VSWNGPSLNDEQRGYVAELEREREWYALLAKAGGLGDFAIGFVEGNPQKPVATIGYYDDDIGLKINCDDLDKDMLPVETPERRAALEARIEKCLADMHNGGHGLVPRHPCRLRRVERD
jgi:hypothetical protein